MFNSAGGYGIVRGFPLPYHYFVRCVPASHCSPLFFFTWLDSTLKAMVCRANVGSFPKPGEC
jgi:hypothetical protein